MKKTAAVLLAAAMILGSLAGCGGKEEKGEKSGDTKAAAAEAGGETAGSGDEGTKGAEPSGEPIKIAMVGAMTGPYSEYGTVIKTGCEVAVKQWNDKGGIHGRPIEMEVYDEKGEREEGLALAQLISGDEDVYGVIGHFMSTTVVGKLYGDARMPLICPTASAEAYSSQSDCTFRLNPTIKVETEAMLVCADAVGKKKLGVVYLNDDWGNRASATLEQILEENNPSGYEIVAKEAILGGDMDYSSVISNLKAAGAETAVMFCYYDSVVPFSIKAAQAYPELRIVCGGSCYNETFLSVGGKDVNGCLAPTAFDANAQDEATQTFVKDYLEISGGSMPSNMSAQAYDAMSVLLEAIDSTGGELDREAIIAAVRDNQHEGLIGSCKFDENRDVIFEFDAMEAKDGAWVPCE